MKGSTELGGRPLPPCQAGRFGWRVSFVALLAASCGNPAPANNAYIWGSDSSFATSDTTVAPGDAVDVQTDADVPKASDVEAADAPQDAKADGGPADAQQADASSDGAGSDTTADGGGDAAPTACKSDSDCDDGDPCTADDCAVKVGLCTHVTQLACEGPLPPCDAKNPCKSGVCDQTLRACVPCVAAKDCPAGNSCVGNVCVAAKPCKVIADCKADGQVCSKSLSVCVECQVASDCGSAQTCVANKCYPAAPCDSDKDCGALTCNTDVGVCVQCLSAADCGDGAACSPQGICKPAICDGNVCGTGDSFFQCKADGSGYQGGVVCSDDNPCTNTSCSGQKGCATKFNTAPCDDGNACTDKDICQAGNCAGKDTLCNDGNPCTIDSCEPASGCVSTPSGGPCDDGDFCTANDSCSGDVCSGKAKVCDDGNKCTDDSCDPQVGCQAAANNAICDDGNKCTQNDKCKSGSCFGEAPGCNDGNPCTTDSCNPLQGCVNTPSNGACDDGNACTANDFCSAGKCLAGTPQACNDNNPCTTDSCAGGQCQYAPNNLPCDDKDPCSIGDSCQNGACAAGLTPQLCNDNNPCTDDSCKAGLGCQYDANSAVCNDNNACTQGDVCVAKKCTGPTPLACDDGDLCTKDSCNPASGCQFAADTAKCDDKDICTTDSCGGGGVCSNQKVPGCCTKQVQCDDGDPCTKDLCVGNQCLNTANGTCCQADSDCNDGSACTIDACVLDKCQTIAVPPPPATVSFGWETGGSLEGWTPSQLSIGGLGWLQASGQGAASGNGAMQFGKAGSDFAGLNQANIGEATSAPIPLNAGGTNTLTFQWKQDFVGLNSSLVPTLQLEVIASGKTWAAWSGSYNALKAFQAVTVDLSALGGQTVQLKLRATVNASATSLASGIGVLVDDLKIQWSCAAKACTADAQCASVAAGPCQSGQCQAGACSYTFKCCTVATDCNDGNSCTSDSCVGGKCSFAKVAGCCKVAADCDDGNVCTFDGCGADGKCKYSGIAECCTANSQCNDSDACTVDSCVQGSCTFQNTCCKSDAECNDKDDVCTIDTCVGGKCSYASTGKPGCCLPILWQEAFDAGALPNWTISNSAGVAKGWQVWSIGAAAPAAKSSPSVLYYGDPLAKNFNFGSNSGKITSAAISIPVATSPSLKFWLYMDTEGGSSYDQLTISVVKNGVTTQVWSKATAAVGMLSWKEYTVNLGGYAGSTVQLQFFFNTVDSVANSGLGVLIDDVRVTNTCP